MQAEPPIVLCQIVRERKNGQLRSTDSSCSLRWACH
uniref:Uncharacterized protein n=1 Tax=Anguilla anguilla TaxID=7936 RepID=A0A0E9VUS1_ANGAN